MLGSDEEGGCLIRHISREVAVDVDIVEIGGRLREE